MNPLIDALDQALELAGQDIILRRTTGQQPNIASFDVTCRASVKSYRLRNENLVNDLGQAMYIVIISPTQIANAGWPGAQPDNSGVDPSIPKKSDHLIIDGRIRNIQDVDPITVGGETVRYEILVLG